MGRQAKGAVVCTPLSDGGTSYALRFTAYKVRRFDTLGTDTEGWTRDRAEAELQGVMADVRRGIWTPPSPAVALAPAPTDDPTFHEFATAWFADYASGVAASTAATVEWRLTYVLLPFFKDHRLSQITIQEVDRYRAEKVQGRDRHAAARARGGKDGPRPLCNNMINRTIQLLGQILELAVEYGHLPANPARGQRRKLKADKPRRPYLDSARQVTALLDAAAALDRESRADRKHVSRHALIAALIFAGLRISEALALRWGDTDLLGCWLTVTESKTDAGRGRKVKIQPVLRDVLRRLRADNVDAPPDALVFGTATGKPQNPSNVRTRVITKAIDQANGRLRDGEVPLPRLMPHGLRRTFASVLYAIGEDPGVVMDELGHTDPDLALTVYRQSMRRAQGEREALRALVQGARIGSNGSGAEFEPAAEPMERAA